MLPISIDLVHDLESVSSQISKSLCCISIGFLQQAAISTSHGHVFLGHQVSPHRRDR